MIIVRSILKETISGLAVMLDLVIQLSYEYPEMFRERAAAPGKRPVQVVKRQAQLMCDRVRIISSCNRFCNFSFHNLVSGTGQRN